MGKNKKIYASAIIILSLIVNGTILGGCESAPIVTDSPDSNKITLRTISMFGGTDANKQYYEQVNEKFMLEHENVIIQDNSQSSDEEWKASINADFAIGNEPDVIQFFTDATADMIVSTDKLVSIDEIREVYPEYAADTLDEALESASNTDGIKRAVPTVGYWEGLYCNKDLFEKYQVDLPTDWSSFIYAINAFQLNGITPVAVSLSNVPHYWIEYLLLYSVGEEEYVKTPAEFLEEADQDSIEEFARALSLFKTLRNLGAFPEDTDVIDDAYASQLFIEKKAAMRLDGSWFASNITDKENTIVIPFPGVPNQKVSDGTAVGGISTGFYITRKAWDDPEKRDIAVEFVMAHTSREACEKYWEISGGVAQATVEVGEMTDASNLINSINEYQDSITRFVAPTDGRIGDAYKTLVNLISPISLGNTSEEDAINEVLREMK